MKEYIEDFHKMIIRIVVFVLFGGVQRTLVFLSILFSERRKRQNRGRGRGRATKGNFFFQVQKEGRFLDIGCWMWSNEGIRSWWIIENWMPIFIISRGHGELRTYASYFEMISEVFYIQYFRVPLGWVEGHSPKFPTMGVSLTTRRVVRDVIRSFL
ncbi:hypothetical protein SUGI_0812370 [Cryptomeria japonica]|nr:hypothetical protein SUGI_0812370 [Cryptomeria japonica]